MMNFTKTLNDFLKVGELTAITDVSEGGNLRGCLEHVAREGLYEFSEEKATTKLNCRYLVKRPA